ncbi:hypothetical protein JL721_4021 [Aureococcus anophagefferens]|nr:hypothetical protein JL721_4021 [Aureococcus anophagefferens]
MRRDDGAGDADGNAEKSDAPIENPDGRNVSAVGAADGGVDSDGQTDGFGWSPMPTSVGRSVIRVGAPSRPGSARPSARASARPSGRPSSARRSA